MALRTLLPRCLKTVMRFPQLQRTCSDSQVPLIFRERYLYSGYRTPHKSWAYYVISLFQIHNESGNVWSHLVAAVLFALKVYHISTQADIVRDDLSWGLLGFAAGTLAYALFSSFAHLFQSKSELIHYTCFQLDYIGIGLNAYGNACLLYYMTGTADFYRVLPSNVFLAINALLAVMVCVCCSVSKLKFRRPYPPQRKAWQMIPCAIHVLFGALPLLRMFQECAVDAACSLGAVAPHLHYALWFVASAFFFASAMPERFVSGKFDIIGHGHQIFHVIMTYTTLLQYETGLQALKNRPRDLVAIAAPNYMTIFGGVVLVLVVGGLFILLTHPHRVAKVKEDRIYERALSRDMEEPDKAGKEQ